MKPVSREKLFTVLDRAAERLHSAERTLLLELPGETVRVPLHEIDYLEVRQNYVTVHAGETYTVKRRSARWSARSTTGFSAPGARSSSI